MNIVEASINGDIDRVRELISAGQDVNETDRMGLTALMWACRNNDLDIVDELIDAGADVNMVCLFGRSALMFACRHQHANIVKRLIRSGANLNGFDIFGKTVLMNASQDGYLQIVRELINGGADVNIMNNDGWTALLLACRYGHENAVRALIKAGAETEKASDVALQYGHDNIARILHDSEKKNILSAAVDKYNWAMRIKSIRPTRTRPIASKKKGPGGGQIQLTTLRDHAPAKQSKKNVVMEKEQQVDATIDFLIKQLPSQLLTELLQGISEKPAMTRHAPSDIKKMVVQSENEQLWRRYRKTLAAKMRKLK